MKTPGFKTVLPPTGMKRLMQRLQIKKVVMISGASLVFSVVQLFTADIFATSIIGVFFLNLLLSATVWLLAANRRASGILNSVSGQPHKGKSDEELNQMLLIQAVEQNPAGILITDLQGIVEYVNPKYEKITGYSKVEITGRKRSEFIPEDQQQKESGIDWDSIAQENGWRGEFKNTQKDGGRFWESVYIVPVRFSSVDICNFLVIINDITREKVAEKKIYESEEKFRIIYNNSPDMYVSVSPANMSILQCNETLLKKTGYTRSEVIGAPILKMYHQDCLVDVEKAFNQFVETGVVNDYELVLKAKDGCKIDVSLNVNSVKNQNGDIIHSVSAWRDITDRKQADKNLRRFWRAVDQSHSAIIITDAEGQIEYVNPGFSQITGYSSGEVFGKQPDFLNSEYHDAQFFENLWAELLAGNAWTGEICNQKKDGSVFWQKANISPVMDRNKNITDFIAVLEDITDLKEAKASAENASRVKSVFLANMSHEIRTPMNSVIGYLNLALDDQRLDPSTSNYLKTSAKSARTLLRIIDDVLDISKLDAGKLVLEKVPFKLRELVKDVLETFDLRVKEKGLYLTQSIDPDLPACCQGDPERLRQVLVNLLGNAVKFTNRGGIHLIVQQEGTSHLKFTIKDTGVGVARDKMKTIFEPFSQADITTTRKFGGTGLGISICRQITALMDGRIWVDSVENSGSAFHFTARLPRIECSENLGHDDRLKNRPQSTSPYQRKFSVLLAEDIEENATLIRIRLEQQGHTVVHVWNGQEAIKLFENNDFDLILMDIHMPRMDGMEACRQIRKMEGNSVVETGIPILALTASVMKEEQQQCLDAGMDGIVEKPIRFGTLFSAMDAVVLKNRNGIQGAKKGDAKRGMRFSPKEEPAGIDLQLAIKTWQDRGEYYKALTGFTSKFGNVCREIELALEYDLKKAAALTHSLKGVAGNLYLKEVVKAVEKVDRDVVRGKTEDARTGLPGLENAMKAALISIKSVVPVQHAPEYGPNPATFLPAEFLQLSHKLKTCFRRGEFDEANLFELIRHCDNRVPSDLLEEFIQAVHNFDFSEAEKYLEQMTTELGLRNRDSGSSL